MPFGSNQNSCQPCGCDPGENDYKCERHRAIQETLVQNVEASKVTPTVTPATPTGIGGAPTRATTFPDDPQGRKEHPVASGVLDYFPDALVAVAKISWEGNNQHNPGQPLHWARGKSTDEADAMIRHFLQRGSLDTDGMRHSAKMAWRALALLQKEIESEQ